MDCVDCKKNNECKYQSIIKSAGITDFKCSHYVEDKQYKAFNINYNITFKIEPEYEEEICEYWSEFYKSKQTLDLLFGKMDKDGYRTCQTWEFIRHIGPFIRMGFKPPFETTVYFESKNLH